MKKIYIITYGCQMNEDDSKKVEQSFFEAGVKLAENLDDADIAVINSCTVRQHAEDKAVSKLGRLKKWKALKEGRKVIFMGCAAERLGVSLKKRFPFVDHIVGAKNLNKIDELSSLYANKEFTEISNYSFLNGSLSAYQTIMRGCSMKCAYCIVPAVRGTAISLKPQEIITQALKKVESGARELVLLGQTVNCYKSEGLDFSDLLQELSKIKNLLRIKFMSPHPIFFNDKFFKLFQENKKIARHIHLPVQSGSDKILKKMLRGYTQKDFSKIIAKLRKADENVSVSTDFIVGFPGETKEDFELSKELAQKTKFSFAFCFKYSPRTDRPQDISDIGEKEMSKRLEELLKTIKENSHEVFHGRVLKTEEIIFENKNSSKTSTGFNCAIINKDLDLEGFNGKLLEVKIERASGNTLYGKVIK